jgi:hypothetical protein
MPTSLGIAKALLERGDPMLEQGLLVLRVVVLGILRDVTELAGDANPVRDLAALVVRQVLDLRLELLVPLWSEDDFLHNSSLPKEKRAAHCAVAGANSSYAMSRSSTPRRAKIPALCR